MQVGEWRQASTPLTHYPRPSQRYEYARRGRNRVFIFPRYCAPCLTSLLCLASSSLLFFLTLNDNPPILFANSPFSQICQITLSQYSVRTVLSVVRPVNFESHDLHIKNKNKNKNKNTQYLPSINTNSNININITITITITFSQLISSNLQEVRLILLLACADPVLLDLLTLTPHILSPLHSFSALRSPVLPRCIFLCVIRVPSVSVSPPPRWRALLCVRKRADIETLSQVFETTSIKMSKLFIG